MELRRVAMTENEAIENYMHILNVKAVEQNCKL